MNHEPRRRRELPLRSKEIDKLQGAITRRGRPWCRFPSASPRGARAKVELALAKGKKAALTSARRSRNATGSVSGADY